MSEQELKRLKRSEILEIMVEQTKAVQTMRAETDRLKDQLEDYRERVKEQNETIARLRAGIVNGSGESEEEQKQLDAVYKQIEEKIRRQRARIKELEAEVARLKKELKNAASKKQEITETTAQSLDRILEPEPMPEPVRVSAQESVSEEVFQATEAGEVPDTTVQINALLDNAKRATKALSRRARYHNISEGRENG